MAIEGAAPAATLQSLMDAAGGPVNMLRSAPLGRYVFRVSSADARRVHAFHVGVLGDDG